MRSVFMKWGSRGITPVISTIILSAVVIAIGGAVWAYAQGASTSISKDYVAGVMDLMDNTIERFTVEHVSYEAGTLKVWIYNYGEINVVADAYATLENGAFVPKYETSISSKNIALVNMPLTAASGSEIAIKIVSRRSNIVYYTYVVP